MCHIYFNAENQKIIQELVEGYEPRKTKEVYMIVRLILNDDIQVYENARRLSITERKAVNKHIDYI